jgi:hypothetical protein
LPHVSFRGFKQKNVEQGTQNYETFMRIVQNTIDPVDPINLADNILNSGKGIITFNVVGTQNGNGATLYKSDQTTIIEAQNTQLNQAFPDYLTGGIPLSRALGAVNVVANDGTQSSLASNLAYGTHGMFVLPSEDSNIENDVDRAADFQRQKDATSEALLQTIEFFLMSGNLAGPVDAVNGRLGTGASPTPPSTTPILDDRAIPTAQDSIYADESDKFKQLN